jgi:membrane protein
VRFLDRTVAACERAVASARERSGLFDHAFLAAQRFSEVLGSRLAAAISYYGFFAAFALAVVVYSILGRILDTAGGGGFLGTIDNYLVDTLPWVVDTAVQVGREGVTTLGLVALLFAGVGWVEALRSSQRAVWLLDQHPGNWFIRRLVDLGMLVGLGALLLFSLLLTAGIDLVLNWFAPRTTFGDMLLRSSAPVLELIVNVVLAAAVLAPLPRLRMGPQRLVPAAAIVGVGIQLLNSVGKWYVGQTENRPAYQLVAGAVGLLVYLYLLNQLILLGAAFAATSTRGTVVDLGAPAPSGRDVKPAHNVGEPRGPARPDTR